MEIAQPLWAPCYLSAPPGPFPQSWSQGLSPAPLFPVCIPARGLFFPMSRTWHLFLLFCEVPAGIPLLHPAHVPRSAATCKSACTVLPVPCHCKSCSMGQVQDRPQQTPLVTYWSWGSAGPQKHSPWCQPSNDIFYPLSCPPIQTNSPTNTQECFRKKHQKLCWWIQSEIYKVTNKLTGFINLLKSFQLYPIEYCTIS